MRRFVSLSLSLASLAVAFEARAQNCSLPVHLTALAGAPATVTDIRHAGTPRQFMLEQAGRIRIYQNGATLPTPFLDLTSVVASGGERGLLSVAFHPTYPTTPWFFVLYTSQAVGGANLGDVRVARYSVSANPDVADSASARVLLTIPHALATNHNGGQLQFSPLDGFLYVSVGDGGGGCDNTGPGCNAQRDDTLLGKLLRIDVNRDTPPFYNVPPSNPFVGPGAPLDEIWAKGLRNPFRMSFDRSTRHLWIGDVGQGTREEIDFQAAGDLGGRNYGWKVMEGGACDTCSVSECPAPVPVCNDPSLTLPVHDYPRSSGGSVIGGYVYRGAAMPAFRGCYVFGDFVSGRVWALNTALPTVAIELPFNVSGLRTFGEDSAGELYLANGASVFKLVPDVPAVPATGTSSTFGLALLLAIAGFVWGRRAIARA